MQADADASGKENIGTDDMIIPRLALAQSVSEPVEEGLIRAGGFWHTILEEDWGTEIDDLVVLHYSKRYVLWSPRHMGGGILARSSDGRRWDDQFIGMEWEIQPYKDQPRHKVKWKIEDAAVGRDVGLGRWGTTDPDNPDSAPAATLTHVLVCISLSRIDRGPFTVLLQRTAEKTGKDLLTKINLDMAPIYGQVYKLSSKVDNGPSGDYFNYKFAKAGHVGTAEEYELCKEWNKQLSSTAFKIDDSTEEGVGGGDSGSDDGEGNY